MYDIAHLSLGSMLVLTIATLFRMFLRVSSPSLERGVPKGISLSDGCDALSFLTFVLCRKWLCFEYFLLCLSIF
jgi:hypothetical protein